MKLLHLFSALALSTTLALGAPAAPAADDHAATTPADAPAVPASDGSAVEPAEDYYYGGRGRGWGWGWGGRGRYGYWRRGVNDDGTAAAVEERSPAEAPESEAFGWGGWGYPYYGGGDWYRRDVDSKDDTSVEKRGLAAEASEVDDSALNKRYFGGGYYGGYRGYGGYGGYGGYRGYGGYGRYWRRDNIPEDHTADVEKRSPAPEPEPFFRHHGHGGVHGHHH